LSNFIGDRKNLIGIGLSEYLNLKNKKYDSYNSINIPKTPKPQNANHALRIIIKMKLYIRYFRNFVFGNYATQGFEISPDSLVIDFKRMIFARIRVEPKYQILRVKNHGQLEVMMDDVSINFYNVSEGCFIYLENIQQKTNESEVIQAFPDHLVNQANRAEDFRDEQPEVPPEVGHREEYDQSVARFGWCGCHT
jgi:hypothetical protein